RLARLTMASWRGGLRAAAAFGVAHFQTAKDLAGLLSVAHHRGGSGVQDMRAKPYSVTHLIARARGDQRRCLIDDRQVSGVSPRSRFGQKRMLGSHPVAGGQGWLVR